MPVLMLQLRWMLGAVVCLGLAAGARTAGAQTAGGGLTARITALTKEPAVARDHWGMMVTAMDGTAIFRLNEAQLFQPASNAKLFTTAAAIALLGPQRRFTTRVEYGPAKGTIIEGDVMIVGAGDGNLSDRELPYRSAASRRTEPGKIEVPMRYLAEFADRIAASGATRITGDVVGDDTAFPWEPYPQDWSIDDLVWGYGAPVSALTLEDNQVTLRIRAGKTVQEAPVVEFQHGLPAYYEVDLGSLKSGPAKSGNHLFIERGVGSKLVRISGSIATDATVDTEEIAISDPAEFAALALRSMLEARGVHVDGIARAKHRTASSAERGFLEESREPLTTLPSAPVADAVSSLLTGIVTCMDACPVILQHSSPTLGDDVVVTNKTSQNLHAELLLHHLGLSYGEDGSTAQGVRVVRQFLLNAGVEKDDFVFFDGSGLSGHDLVTPRATARLLAYAVTQPWFAAWKASLPVGGVDGSLEGRFRQAPLKGHVFAKTGTLGEARALGGYLECASGRTVIFSIMVGNHLPGTSADREVMDRIVGAIAAAN